jgi:hypothetical protein
MKTRFNWNKLLATFAVVFAVATVRAGAAQVTASLDPAQIALGDSAQLTVTITGNENAQPQIPAVSGLEFTSVGQSSSFQSINGAVTSSVSLTYQVTPDRAGTFTIPAIRLSGGESSQPLILRVLKNAAGAPALSLYHLPSPNVASATPNATANANGEPAFLRVILPKRELYVGELVPVRVKAYFRAGMAASLNGLPVLSSDAFTLNKLDDKPDETQELVGDQPYTVLTWSSALAAVKAGDYPVNLELPVVVRVQERGRRGDNPFKQFFGNSPFDNSFFNDPDFDDFFGGVTEKPLTLHTDLENLKVLSLPAAGRPADFSGAVGRFDVSSEAAPAQLTAGDPVTLRVKVSGQGNFDRVFSRGLAASAAWKTYPPSAQFAPADNAGYAGTKTFEQAVVPLQAGQEKIPALTFSYFDPDARQYVTRTTTPIAIAVAPGSAAPAVAALPASSATSPISPAANLPASELAPNKVETGDFVSSLRPVLFAPWFVAAQGVPVMALIAGLLIHRRRERQAHDPQYARAHAAQAAVRAQLAAMDQALAANRAPEFFSAARQAVQERLAQRWQLPASEVTPAEINRRWNGDAGDLRNLFAAADAVVYSGQRVPPAELQRWKKTVIHQLEKLEES